MSPVTTCPARETLHQLLLGFLSDSQAEVLEQHLLECDTCVQAAREYQAEDSLIQAMRVGATATPAHQEAGIQALIEQLQRLRSPAPGTVPDVLAAPLFSRSSTAEEGYESVTQDLSPTEAANPDQTSAPAAPALLPVWEEMLDFLAPPQGPGELGRLGPYRILKILGAGGMGIVFQAEDPQLQRWVALKVMRPNLAINPTARQRFLREARAAAALEHDHIVHIYLVGEDRGVPFLAMPLLRGQPLDQKLQCEGALPIPQVLRIGREMAEGLAAAHERGLIHRDIKPGNIWLEGPRNRVKILDFGLARAGTDNIQLTQSGAIVGTPAYMAPEQARAGMIDARCDLFSLGCVLYHLCTGEVPFKGSDPLSTLAAVALDNPLPPRERNSQVPPVLSDLVMQLLAKNPSDRPPSARVVVEILEAIEHGQPVRETRSPLVGVDPAASPFMKSKASRGEDQGKRPTEQRPQTWLPFRFAVGSFHRRRLLIAAIVVLGALGLAGYLYGPAIFRNGTNKITKEGQQPAVGENALDKPGQERVGEIRQFEGHAGPIRSLAFSPDGRRILSGSGFPEGDKTVRLWDVANGKELSCFEGHTDQVESVAFSPDNRHILSAGYDKTIRLWDSKTGKEVQQIIGHTDAVHTVAFSPDGHRVVSGSSDQTVRLWDLASGQELKRILGHTGWIQQVVFCPDGGRILTCDSDGTARLWDCATGAELTRFTGHTGWICSVAPSPDGRQAVSAGEDKVLRLWDTASGQELLSMRGHTKTVWSVAFSPDGHRILSGSEDGTVRLWDVKTGKELHRYQSTTEKVWSVAFSPGGRTAISGGGGTSDPIAPGNDWTIHQWLLPDPSAASPENPFLNTGQLVIESDAPDAQVIFKTGPGAKTVSPAPIGLTDVPPGDYEIEVLEPKGARPVPEKITLAGGTQEVVKIRWVPLFDSTFAAKETQAAEADLKPLLAREGDPKADKELLRADALSLRQKYFGTPQAVRAASLLSRLPSPLDRLELMKTSTEDPENRQGSLEPAGLVGILGDSRLKHWNEVRRVAFSPDGKILASASFDRTVKLWNPATGKEIRTLVGHQGEVWTVAFRADGQVLASAGADGTVRLWETATGKALGVFSKHRGPITLVAFSPDSKLLAAGCLDSTVQLWDITTGKEQLTLTGHLKGVNSVAFSPDGQTLASGSFDGTVKLWKVATGENLRTMADVDWIGDVVFSPDGRLLASACGDGSVKLWEVNTGEESNILRGHLAPIQSVAFGDGGRILASGGDDGTVKLWETATGKNLRTLETSPNRVWAVAFSPDSRVLAAAGTDGTVRMFDLSSGKVLFPSQESGGPVNGVAFSPDGKLLGSGHSDGTVQLWDLTTGRVRRTMKGHGGLVWGVAFSPDGTSLASASEDRTVKLWEVGTGKELHTLAGYQNGVCGVLFSPDGRVLASMNGNQIIKIWNTENWTEIDTLTVPGTNIYFAFTPNSKAMAFMSHDDTVALYDLHTKVQRILNVGQHRPGVAFSPDGTLLASGAQDGSVKLWETPTAKELWTKTGPWHEVDTVAFSPDGRTLAMIAHDGTVRLWDPATGKPRAIFSLAPPGNWSFTNIAFSPDSRYLATANRNGTIAILRLAPPPETPVK